MQRKRLRVKLDQGGRRNLREIEQRGTKRWKYAEAKPIEPRSCSVWIIESDLGEKKLLVCAPEMRVEQVVGIVKCMKWRKRFTVGVLSAGDLLLTPDGHHWYSPDGRRVNQN